MRRKEEEEEKERDRKGFKGCGGEVSEVVLVIGISEGKH